MAAAGPGFTGFRVRRIAVFAYSAGETARLDSSRMNKTLLLLVMSLPGTLGSSVVCYFIGDIALVLFGSATYDKERLVMLALLCLQLAFVFCLARCIRRRHCAELRAVAG